VASPREFSTRFWALIGATFLGFVGIGTVLPGLAPHVRHDLGGSDRSVGFVIGIFSVVALGGRLFSGPLADNRGRKTAFLTGLGSCAAAGAIYLLPMGITGIWIARSLQGFGEACLYTGAAAWAVELAGTRRSAQALGYLSSGIWGGLSSGPVVGQWLGTFERAAFFQMIAAGVGFVMLSRVREHYEKHEGGSSFKWPSRSLVTPGLAIGFVNVQYPVIVGFLVLHLARFGNSGNAAFTAYAGSMLCSRFFLGGLPDRIHPRFTFFGGLTLMATGLLILASGPTPPVAVGAAAILGLGFSFPFSSIASTVMRRARDRERGSAVSTLSAFYDLFVGMGSFAAGALSGKFGYASAFVMAAVALGPSALAGWFVLPAEIDVRLPEPSSAV
jgi:MFS family permease